MVEAGKILIAGKKDIQVVKTDNDENSELMKMR